MNKKYIAPTINVSEAKLQTLMYETSIFNKGNGDGSDVDSKRRGQSDFFDDDQSDNGRFYQGW